MSGLFGAAATTTTAASNTTGDISKDVALNSPPEDSISDLRFSPASDHLAVASWDKKVRIYEINDQGQSEGKALFEHEAPVLNCCWSPVSFRILLCFPVAYNIYSIRTAQKSLVQVQTRRLACSILQPMPPHLSRSPPTTPRSDAATCFQIRLAATPSS